MRSLVLFLLLTATALGQGRGRGRFYGPQAPQKPTATIQSGVPSNTQANKPSGYGQPAAAKAAPKYPAINAPPAILAGSHEFVDADADRSRFPIEDRPFLFYFSTASYHPDDRAIAEHSLYFVVASLSHKTDLEQQLPVRVGETLYRIDLRGLGWEHIWHTAMVRHYPFIWKDDLNQKFYSPLVVRADWFVSDGYDETKTGEFQYLLLYGGRIPKTREDFLSFWGVHTGDPEYVFGMIEGESGVATQAIRQVETHPTSKRGYSYFTKDSARIAGKTDPLENLPNGAAFDAQEYIVGVYKVRRGRSGNVQAYFLTDGNGRRQAKAPVEIVEDRTNTRGREICNSSSCVYCHTSGVLPPTKNEYVTYIKDPTRLFNDQKTRYKIERYHGSDIAKEIRIHQQAYSDGIAMVNGLTAGQNSRHFQICVQLYSGKANIDQVARELSILYGDRLTAKELRLALGMASKDGKLKGRLAQLAEGIPISRDMVNENWFELQEIISQWNSKTRKQS